MHKKTRFLVLIVFIMTAFVLFGRNTTYKDVPLSEIETKVMAKADSSKFKKADSKSLKRYIGLNEKDYSEVVYLMPSSTMEVSELLIVKVKNEAQADAIESAVNNRVETQENSFKDYAPEQYAVLQNSSVLIKGNYVFYVVSDNVEDMKNEFLDTIK